MKPTVIGLVGLAQAGKTTVAHALCDLMNRTSTTKARVMSFASPLKTGLAEMGVTKEGTPDLYRRCAQWMGTEGVRAHDPDHWVNLLKQRIDEEPGFRYIIIDDVRFENEMKACDEVFHIVRPNQDPFELVTGWRRWFGLRQNLKPVYRHASERMAVAWRRYGPPAGVPTVLNSVCVSPFAPGEWAALKILSRIDFLFTMQEQADASAKEEE